MIKVKVDALKTGDVTAEHIINSEGQVLLSAGTVLSRKTITLLKLWEIKEIKLREETDSDNTIRLSLQFDEIVHKNSHLFDHLKPSEEITQEKKSPIVLSSIISETSLRQYDNISCKLSKLFTDIKAAKDTSALTAISNIIYHYVVTTPCVIGYTLKQELKNIEHEDLIDHSMSVAIVSAKIAKLLGYPPAAIQTIIFGALLHDIGKLQLPARLCQRNGYISPKDKTLYQRHVQLGYDLVKSLELPRDVTLIVTQHHEYNDGSGFPLHLKAPKIHPYGQIVAFANMFDTLVHEQDGLPNFFDIRTKLIRNGAGKIKEDIIDVFDQYLKDFIFNVNVELNDGRTAEVIYTHPSYMSLVVRTTDGDFVDLSKNKDLWIKKSFL